MIKPDDLINMAMEQVPIEMRPRVKALIDRQKTTLLDIESTGEAGAGMVKVTVSSANKLKKIKIEPKLLTGADDDAQFIENLIMAAYTNACESADREFQKIVDGATDEMMQLLAKY